MLTGLANNTLILASAPQRAPDFLEMNFPMVDIGVKHIMLTEVASNKLINHQKLIVILIRGTGRIFLSKDSQSLRIELFKNTQNILYNFPVPLTEDMTITTILHPDDAIRIIIEF